MTTVLHSRAAPPLYILTYEILRLVSSTCMSLLPTFRCQCYSTHYEVAQSSWRRGTHSNDCFGIRNESTWQWNVEKSNCRKCSTFF